MKTPSDGGHPEYARTRLGPSADRSLTLTRALLSQPTKDTMRGAMRRSLRIAAVLCSARGLVAPARRAAPTRLMSSASGAPEDETRGGTASLADQVARARTRVRKRFARASRETGACCGESLFCAALRREVAAPTSERALRSVLLRRGERSKESTRSDDARERPHTHAKKHTVRPSAKGRQPALPRHRERV